MGIYDKTQDLAMTLKESGEYADFLRCKALINKDPESIVMLKEFRQYQVALQIAKFSGEGLDEVNDALLQISLKMGDNEHLSQYLTAEYNLSILIQKIQSILTDGLDLVVEAEYNNEEDIYFN